MRFQPIFAAGSCCAACAAGGGAPPAAAAAAPGGVGTAGGSAAAAAAAAAPAVAETADAAASAASAYTVAVGQRFHGTVGATGDQDWIGIDLVAGTAYVFTAFGTGGSTAGLDDTLLRLIGPAGGELARSDDVAPGNGFSAITFTATASGRHHLAVQAAGGERGSYAVTTATATYRLDDVVSQLTELAWGIPAPIRFEASPGGGITVDLSALNADGQRLAGLALEAWEYATGIDFVVTTGGGARIVFDDAQSGAFAGPSAVSAQTGINTRSDVNVGSAWLASYGSAINTYSFFTYLHEIGHALGLGHMGPYNGAADYPADALFRNDSWQMSVMSYFDLIENGAVEGSGWLPVTPMIGDIAAVHALYGTPTGVNAGNTVWGANATLGGVLGRIMGYLFDGDASQGGEWAAGGWRYPAGFTIFDQGGIDVLDVSTHAGSQRIDLRPEAVSDILGETGNVVIMRGTVIENAKAGEGSDRVTGNAAGNRIEGRGGNDTIDGGEGHDSLLGGLGEDSLAGRTGQDTLDGGAGRDSLAGGSDADLLYGRDGRDLLQGGDAADRLFGDAGDDTLQGDGAGDRLFGGSGRDRLDGGSGADLLSGGAEADLLFGGAGADTLQGDGGSDTMSGGAGADVFVFDLRLPGGASDTVTDFVAGSDRLRLLGLPATGPEGFAALHVTAAADWAEIAFGDHLIRLAGVDAAALSAADVLFV
jgi:serralysin